MTAATALAFGVVLLLDGVLRPPGGPDPVGMNRDARTVGEALARHVPAGVSSRLNIVYDKADPEARLDVFYPATVERSATVLPAVVWVHGGGWISGSKDYLANYLRILAARGFSVVGVGYSVAPHRTYPTPLRQLDVALSYLTANAADLHIDASRLFLAGDSAGAQIAAQFAALVSAPAYAKEVGIMPGLKRANLRGLILYCGLYDVTEQPAANFSQIMRMYFGAEDFANDRRYAQFAVTPHVTADFPPMFISVGNGDTLLGQSRRLIARARSQGVPVDDLLFADDYQPRLGHEYQFNLGLAASRLALDRSVEFLRSRSK